MSSFPPWGPLVGEHGNNVGRERRAASVLEGPVGFPSLPSAVRRVCSKESPGGPRTQRGQ